MTQTKKNLGYKVATASGILTDITQISAGNYGGACGVQKGGKIFCWGYNGYGHLGNGNTTNQWAAVQVNNITTAARVESGYHHTCALLADASVKCWGRNDYGQLGDGTTSTNYAPQTVLGLSNVVGLTVGGTHTCAVKSDGTAWCWGNNASKQLGLNPQAGTPGSLSVPAQVNTASGLTNATSISAGYDYTCATRNDKTVWCWGYNAHGELGNTQSANNAAPVQVQYDSDDNGTAESMLTGIIKLVANNGYFTCVSNIRFGSSGIWQDPNGRPRAGCRA